MVDLIVSIALKILLVLLLFGEIAKYKEACVKKYNPSGKPTLSKASQQDCTKEACNFKENWDLLQKNNIVVLGISKDNASSHQKFIEKFNLPFILLTDPEPFKVSSDYDSYGLKKFMGKEYMGMMRNTFLIDTDGNIEKIYLKVKAAIMADHIIADLKLS